MQEPTAEQMKRVQADWNGYAGEAVRIEYVKGTLYAFGSELAIRRLGHKFRSFNLGWSENRQSWYFNLCREGS